MTGVYQLRIFTIYYENNQLRIYGLDQHGSTNVYYTSNWQVIEERDGSGAVTTQYIMSPVYVDAMVLRDRDTDANGSLDERLYVMQDANFNVTAIVSLSDQVLERYTYLPYGDRMILNADWSTDTDGISDYAFQHGHQGGKLDPTTGLYHFRNREYSPVLGRWMQQDPAGYVDGMSLVQYLGGSPGGHLDATGLQWYPGMPTPMPPPSHYSKPAAITLGAKITSLFLARNFQGSLVNASLILAPLISPSRGVITLQDDASEMASTWNNSTKMRAFYREYILREVKSGSFLANNDWQVLKIDSDDVRNLTRLPGETSGNWEMNSQHFADTGWWLHGAERVSAQGSVEVRCFGGRALQIRNVSVTWQWHDSIDSNPDWEGDIVAASAEWIAGVAQFLTNSEFQIVIPWKHENTEVQTLNFDHD